VTRLLVLNADDLGLAPEADEGIAAAAAVGLVTEASLLVTAGQRARTGLATGLHLCLTEGRALTGRLKGLTDRSGRFLSLPRVVTSCLARAPRPDEVRREVAAQLSSARELGATIGHLNGHHHVHLLPVVRDAVIEIARAEGIAHVRVPCRASVGGARGLVVGRLAAGFRRVARGSGLRTLPVAGFPPRVALLGRATEVILHPRAGGAELSALLDPAWRAQLGDFRPARYAETEAVSETL